MNLTSVASPCGSIRLKILGSDLNPHFVWEATEVTKPAEPGLKPLPDFSRTLRVGGDRSPKGVRFRYINR